MNSFNFKKKYGQNFINDKNIINKIVDASNIDENTLVIEVGPGAGSLTKELCKTAGMVVAYEIDKELEKILKEELKEFNNIEIIFEDFLKADVISQIKKYKYSKIHLVANLPYYITTPIITKVIDSDINVNQITIMVQKEVGERFNAKPGTKSYNSLTIFLNYYYKINKVIDVSRNVFTPKPNVDSVVINMIKNNEPIKVNNKEAFFNLVRESFKFKRKTLKNNLKEYDLNKIEEVLQSYNLDLQVRAEQLPIDIFVDISNNL